MQPMPTLAGSPKDKDQAKTGTEGPMPAVATPPRKEPTRGGLRRADGKTARKDTSPCNMQANLVDSDNELADVIKREWLPA